jgi:deoxyribonuclease IV
MRLLGAHMSAAGGADKAIERGAEVGCKAIQIFVKNNNRWFGKPLEQKEIDNFIKKQKETGIFVFAHTGYLINLAGPKPENHKRSIRSMLEELEKCEQLKIPFTVLHPGSYLDTSEEVGIKKIAKSLDALFKATKGYKVKVLLENTAGQGSSIGSKFKQLAQIINLSSNPNRLGICFDTAHAYAAGYDIKTKEGYKKTWDEFDQTIGINKLMAFHLNDSKQPLSSHKDRHEHIGKGTLGIEAFRMLLNDKRFTKLPMVLETPKDPDMKEDLMNLKVIKSLI